MKVGFDISQIAHAGGVATYTRRLAEELVKQPSVAMTFFYASLRKPYTGTLPNVKTYPLPPTFFEIVFNSLRVVPIESFIGQVDIFHSSDWVQPPTKAKKVTTVHDLVPFLYPQWSHPRIVRVAKKRLAILEKEIDMVITVSEATKQDLLKVSTIPEDKITVVYEGVSEAYRPDVRHNTEKLAQIKAKYRLPDKFLLNVGTVQPRKNLPALLRAYEQLASAPPLFIAGLSGWGEDLPQTDNVTLLGYIDETDLPYVYAAAYAFVYPALYEGFGLPVLEALACGTPVVTSNVSSLPEVGGDAAMYVDPKDDASITSGLEQVLQLSESAYQYKQEQGIAQAKQFTWQRAAAQTIDVYKQVVGT